MIVTPALISPLRWIDTNDYNKSFDGNFAANQLQWYQSKRCYFQPFQTGDRLKLQIIADDQPADLDLVSCETNQVTVSIPFVEVPNLFFTDFPDYRVYELDYSFAALAVGKYYASLEQFTSEPIDVQVEHLNTTLIKYKHSDNDFDVVFDTGIEFQIRVESLVSYINPKSNRDVYYDQPYNSTQLNSVTFRNFKLYLGYSFGLPEWMFDKVAHVIGCDQVSYDNVYYQVTQGADFETEKNDDNNWMGGSIDVQQVDNNFIRYITSGIAPQQTFTPVQKIHRIFNISGNQTVSGVFKAESNLEKIIIYKTGADYTIRIGTTSGGNEIGEFLVDDNTGVVKTVEWTFTGTSNVFISGSGLNAVSLTFVYKQLDENPLPLIPTTPTDSLKKGAKMLWDGTYTDFLLNWDEATGLGKANTGWEKWCIAGTNGTTNVDGKLHVGIVTAGTPDYETLGDSVGSNSVTIARENLPAEGVNLFTNAVTASGTPSPTDKVARARSNGSQALNYEMVNGGNLPVNIGVSGNMGSGVAMSVQNASVISLFIVKLED